MYLDDIWKWKHSARPEVFFETGYEQVIQGYNIISVEDFKRMPLSKQVEYARVVLHKIRAINIYPIYYYTPRGIREEIIKCLCTDTPFTGKELVQNSRSGLTLLDFLFPNLHRVEAGNSKSNCMYSRFYDDDKMLRILCRHMKNYPFTNMRTPFFMYGRFFWNTATNFNPMRAKAIYERFCPAGGTIYDFSAGFGGRMLGALSSAKSKYTYIACEPCIDTFYNLRRLGTYIESVTGRRQSYKVYNEGSEVFEPDKNSVDFAFSCPPYFALERYSTEPTQSVVKFPKYDDWLNYYVLPTLQHATRALRPGATLGYVIHDIRYLNKDYALKADWMKMAIESGLIYVDSFPILSRSRKQHGNVDTIFIFKKEVR